VEHIASDWDRFASVVLFPYVVDTL